MDSIGRREVLLLAQLAEALTDRDKSREREAVLHGTVSDLEGSRARDRSAFRRNLRGLDELRDAHISKGVEIIIKEYEESTGDTVLDSEYGVRAG